MNFAEIIAQLTSERDRLDRAIAALNRVGGRGERRAGSKSGATPKRVARRMSAATRKRLAAMMRKRWAERKKAGKTRL